ncbi:MAG TPA: translation factor GTPase family protein [Actinophytocola sp.]|nr:translation factor GTPase family protein [Actinophytocola sp.]
MRTLNLGILAHVDAGKTSLTERLLHGAGVIDELGSVDAGSTRTDSLALERQRGITIRSAVVSFRVGDVAVNLIDTPGHPDFIAEVERVLGVLDGAVLVVSAVEGVQAQTRLLMRTLRRLRIPVLIFVNKVDRAGARHADLLADLAAKLTPAVVPMGTVDALGTRDARFVSDVDDSAVEVLAEHDDALLAAYVDGDPALPWRDALVAQSRRGLVHPVYFGSAVTGTGVEELTAGIVDLLPATEGDPDAPVSGTVFTVERGPAGEKVAYVRMFAGTVRVRDRVRFGGTDGKVTAIEVVDSGGAHRAGEVTAGRIGKLWGLTDVRIGDALGCPHETVRHRFAPPTLETVVEPVDPAAGGALHAALTQLAEQDPLIDLRQDPVRREILVSLYGEVQKEVIQATLATEFGVEVTFRETTTVHVERPAGVGEAVELIGVEPNPFLATVGLRVEPAPEGAGNAFRLGVELGSMPYAFFAAVEETVTETLRQGLHGWAVLDCVVTMTHSGYWARQSHSHGTFDKSMSSTAGDFRNLTPLVLMAALRRAGTVVHEPLHRFTVEVPADTLGAVLPVLARLRAVPRGTDVRGATAVVTGDIPAARVHGLEQRLPGLTRGEGVLEAAFDHHAPVRGEVPSRPRTDHDPLNRREYLLHVVRRVTS